MIAICPAGPPKLMKPSFTQNRSASPKDTDRGAGGCVIPSLAFELEDGGARAQVRQRAHLAAFLQPECIEDGQPVAGGQHLEILEGADADVRRVVPLVRQALGHLYSAAHHRE